MNKITQLKKEEAKIRNEINAIEKAEIQKVQIPRLKKMVGQCFAYRGNSYGGDRIEDTWDVFRKIIDWVESKERGFCFIVEEISVDKDGKISWEIDSSYPYTNREWWNAKVPFSGYEKISEKEYNAEKLAMIEEMKTQRKMRKILNSKWT